MRFALLGPVETTADGSVVPIPRPQRRAVLAYLLLHANRTVSIDQLIDALWGGAEPETARAQIYTTVAVLRRVLRQHGGTEAIVTGEQGYRMVLDTGQLDLEIFTGRVADARVAAARDDHSRAVHLLQGALNLWRGRALGGITVAYVDAVRALLHEQWLTAQEDLAEAQLLLGRHAELVVPLTAVVTAYPLREHSVRQLMLALYRRGQQADALGVARALRQRLIEEHGLDPSPEFGGLEQAILRAEPTLDWRARSVPTSTGSAPRATTVSAVTSRSLCQPWQGMVGVC